MIFGQALLALVGIVHALAAWFYFSKENHAAQWAAAWLFATALALWLLPTYTLETVVAFGALIAAWTWWWESIAALTERNWVPEDAQQATATIVDRQLHIANLRNFIWHSSREFTPVWENRSYDIDQLDAVDIFVSTWGDPRIAHIIVSFVFDDSPPLAFSIETRRETHEKWSVFAGFMKSYELIMIAADERDVIRVRTNIRNERVRRYRIQSTPEMRERILMRYVRELNDLAVQPRFYNTLYRNCTTEVAFILREAGQKVPLDWRLLVTGYLPQYLYEYGLLANDQPFESLQAAADIGPLAQAADAAPDFWRRIREGAGAAIQAPPG